MTDKELAKLRLEMVEATRLSFDACRREHPNETIYAYALVMCSRGGEALQPWCHSEEIRAKQEAKWPSADEQTANLKRYCPDEWWAITSEPIKTSRGRGWDEIRNDLNALYMSRQEDEPQIVMDLLIDTLAALDSEGYFGTGKARNAITLMTYISDSGGDGWAESVRRLNPPAVRKRFEDAVG